MTFQSTTTPAVEATDQISKERKPRVTRSKEQWKTLVSSFEASGLTMATFCKQSKISSSGLHKWRKHFSKQAPGSEFIEISEPLSACNTPASAVQDDDSWRVELDLGNGVVLRVRTA